MKSQTTPVVVEAFGKTDRGRVRETNEDQFLIANLNKSMMVEQTSLGLETQTRLHGVLQGTLLVVADGMGGHSYGDVASRVAVEALASYTLNTMPWFFRLDERHGDDLEVVLEEALRRCESAITDLHGGQGDRKAGTTVTMAYILWPNLYLVHAGDSRAYLRRDGKLYQISHDHTMAQRIAEETGEDPEELAQGRLGHVLANAVGAAGEAVSPEVKKYDLDGRDTLLLCSDGLTDMLEDEKINAILGSSPGAESACRELLEEAIRAGGEDNVTVVVSRFKAEQGS